MHIMKFLIAGLGSIGQRHYKNLIELGHKDITVYRTGKGDRKFVANFEKIYNPIVFDDLKTALLEKPDVLIISNPTIFHAEFIKLGIQNNLKGIFVEKPAAVSANSIKNLVALADKNNAIVYIAYNFRFHPLLQRMRKFLTENAIGKVLSASVDMGEYLPDWHPWEDYRYTYAARADLGGGVVLTQSHDIDYLYWFFGMPDKIAAFGGTRTGLEVSAEDLVKAVFDYSDGSIASLNMDFYRRPPRRTFEIIGTAGTLLWDYHNGTLTFTPHEQNKKAKTFAVLENFNRNQMFLSEMKHFVNCVKGKDDPKVTFKDGLNVLRICEAILKSMNTGKIVKL